jgi:hypothetical protein
VVESRAPRDVFLCHAGPDKRKIVVPFVKALRRNGISYWVDETEIGWGHRITEKINQGLADCRFVVVFLTDAFLRRNWPQSELASALNAETSSGRLVVLPILVATPERVFAKYPLLRDKRYLAWAAGVEAIVAELQLLLGAD